MRNKDLAVTHNRTKKGPFYNNSEAIQSKD